MKELFRKFGEKIVKILANIISYFFVPYFFAAFFIFTPYYNWNYARTNGFVKWLFFGEVIATAKAIIWPYYIISSSLEKTESTMSVTASSVSAAIDYKNKATLIQNKGGPYQGISEMDFESIKSYYKKALQEAKKADLKAMNRSYPGLGDHFRDEFIQGIEMFISSNETGDSAAIIQSQLILAQWDDWFNANIEGIRASRYKN